MIVVAGEVYVSVAQAGIVRHEQALEIREGGYVVAINVGVEMVVLALRSKEGVGSGDRSLIL